MKFLFHMNPSVARGSSSSPPQYFRRAELSFIASSLGRHFGGSFFNTPGGVRLGTAAEATHAQRGRRLGATTAIGIARPACVAGDRRRSGRKEWRLVFPRSAVTSGADKIREGVDTCRSEMSDLVNMITIYQGRYFFRSSHSEGKLSFTWAKG